MKLIKKKTRTYKGKTYYKYMITIPSKLIKELGWEEIKDLHCKKDKEKALYIKINGHSKTKELIAQNF